MNGRRYWLFAVGAGLAVFALGYLNRLVFPYPWNDEARFYLPALWWAEHASLKPLNVNAPEGIFWVPDGFTIWLGLGLRVFGESMQVARTLMEATVAGGVTVFALAFRRLAGSWVAGAIATLFLLTPPVIFAANMVRMEAPLFLLLALAAWCEVSGYRVAAGALLVGSLVVHPALGLAALGYLVVAFVWRRDSPVRPWEWVLAAGVLTALVAEGVHLAANFELVRVHLAYQAARKMQVPLLVKLLRPQSLALYAGALALGLVGWRRALAVRVGVIAIAVMVYAVLGGEMEYAVYLLAVGPALVFCLIWVGVRGDFACAVATGQRETPR